MAAVETSRAAAVTSIRSAHRRWAPDIRTRELIAALIVLSFVLVAILAPWMAPEHPDKMNLLARYLGPEPGHILGTDHRGREIHSR